MFLGGWSEARSCLIDIRIRLFSVSIRKLLNFYSWNSQTFIHGLTDNQLSAENRLLLRN